MSKSRIQVPVELAFDYELRQPQSEPPHELIVLLHGYGESGSRIFGKLEPALPANAIIIAPNAPFPMFHRSSDGKAKLVYSWYFYDSHTQEYFIDMSVALDFIDAGLRRLGFRDLPKRLIGFSQGGYLAPFVAQRISGVRQVIGLACEYLADEITGKLEARVDGIHGAADDVVPVADARLSHAKLRARGVAGELHVLEESTHRIDSAFRSKLSELLLE